MTREIKGVDICEWIRSKRKEKGMSREQLASKLNCHETSIGRWERGDQYPPFDITEDIVKIMGAEIVIREKKDERADEEFT